MPALRRKGREITATQEHMVSTGNIVFTREVEANNNMSSLEAKSTRKEDGNVNSTVYRKETHSDQV